PRHDHGDGLPAVPGRAAPLRRCPRAAEDRGEARGVRASAWGSFPAGTTAPGTRGSRPGVLRLIVTDVRIHYHRPPDRCEIYVQRLVARAADVVITLNERTPLARPLVVDGRVILEDGSPVVWFTFQIGRASCRERGEASELAVSC